MTLRMAKQQEVIVLISAAKIGLYEGAPNLTNYPATRIHINPSHHCILELQKSLKEPTSEAAMSPPPEDVNYPTIESANLSTFLQTRVNCKVKVTKVKEGSSWFYAVCTKCPKKILRDQGVFKCTDCNRIIPYPDKSR
nr:PREDICTED: uncharacterized protein LOC108192664 [Daucus carota subsp. sativus]